MKLAKSKLQQLIRESLADYDGYGSPSDDDLEYLNTLPPKTSEKDLLASLSKEEKELAEDVLGWWAKQIDETGRLSGHTGKDGSLQRRLWADEVLTNPPPGAEPVGLYICELVLEALKGWEDWGDANDLNWKREDIATLIKKFEAILDGDEPEQQPEPEVPAGEKVDQRFAHLDIPSDESMATRAVKRYKEGKSMKITKSKLRHIIAEAKNRRKLKEADVSLASLATDEEADATDLVRAKLNTLIDAQADIIINTPDDQFSTEHANRVSDLNAQIVELATQLADLEGIGY